MLLLVLHRCRRSVRLRRMSGKPGGVLLLRRGVLQVRVCWGRCGGGGVGWQQCSVRGGRGSERHSGEWVEGRGGGRLLSGRRVVRRVS